MTGKTATIPGGFPPGAKVAQATKPKAKDVAKDMAAKGLALATGERNV